MKTNLLFFFISIILLSGCTVDEKFQLPEINTQEIIQITDSSAVSGGLIISKGNSKIIARGICWSFDSIPTVSDFKTVDGSGDGLYASVMGDLIPNMDYYVRAYYILDNDIVYGNQLKFRTSRKPFYVPGPDIEYSFNFSGNGASTPSVWQLIASKTIDGEHLSSLITGNEMSIIGITLNNGQLILSGGQYNFNGIDSIKICYKLLDSVESVVVAVGSPNGSDQKLVTFDTFMFSKEKAYEMIDKDKIVSIYAMLNQNSVNFFKTDAVFTFIAKSTLAVLWM